MTKSAEIRGLLKQGLSRSAVAARLGTSYQFVYQVDKKRNIDPKAALAARERARKGKPFPIGTRVVHKRQIAKGDYGVVLQSNPYYTTVAYTYRHPAPEAHYCQYYSGVPCIHNRRKEGKLLPGVSLPTPDLEIARRP
jgi:hypothetical protein